VTAVPDALLKYQRQRSVTGPWKLQGDRKGACEMCVVIPALGESAALPQTLDSLSKNSADALARSLIVVVVNQRTDAADALKKDNLKTLELLHNHPAGKLRLAWIDACSCGTELPPKQGVGLARKIGFDLSLSRLSWNDRPVLVSLDADTLVSPDYLAELLEHFRTTSAGGAVIPFRHIEADDPLQERAIRRYELYLRSYVLGLQLAGSPYAYTSIGSAFACTAKAYIQAGGMNRRQAGEDFYFLQQVAKTTGMTTLQGGMVRPSPRPSERVPFGTGKAVSMQNSQGGSPFFFSDKAAFLLLQKWLALASQHWQTGAAQLLNRAEELDHRLAEFLTRLNVEASWTRLQANYRSPHQFIRGFHCWFDGLRTRQLLTTLAGSESGSELELINELFRWGEMEEKNSASEQLLALERLQGIAVSTR